ncbi:tetratricopeptide repeat protein [Ideonella livida]|uniref:Cytochrome c-type biogenesis protein H TPR domain-containing protein n=1 Tax=Ideonella livida TaxID=2707176 RepID=A0A7C9TK40_9BURK|nr:hypothetical protein [Ideonella livida]NDY91484.1 hypothetical protein [Ideonella livida]
MPMTFFNALPPWLLPFMAAAVALVALFSASLVWAAGAPQAPAANAAPSGVAPGWARGALWMGPALAVLLLYVALGTPRALNPAEHQADDPAAEMEARVERLLERLRREPQDRAGWLMLGRSLKVLGRLTQAADAYAQAGDAALADPDVLTDWVEARILVADHHFDDTSRALLARAMALAPDHPGVLLLRGLAALDRGDPRSARQAFAQLREQHSPDSPDRAALDEAIRRLDAGQDPRARPPSAGPGQGR